VPSSVQHSPFGFQLFCPHVHPISSLPSAILRAAAQITGENEFIVIGSQALLGSHPDAPRSLCRSIEGDTYPKHHPERAIDIDDAIGELSPFHQEIGYYALGIAPETATQPTGWEDRLVEFRVDDPADTCGWCLEKHDLAFSKLAAGRSKDLEYIGELLAHKLINRGKIQRLIDSEENTELKSLLTRNWRIITSKQRR